MSNERVEKRPLNGEAGVLMLIDELAAKVMTGELQWVVIEPGTTLVGPPVATILVDVDSAAHVTLPFPGRDGTWVQFVQDDAGNLFVEAVSDEFLPEPLTHTELDALRELGWRSPDEDGAGSNNWWVTARPEKVSDAVELIIATLVQVYAVALDVPLLTPTESAARRQRRLEELREAGLPDRRSDALADTASGPYSVILNGLRARHSTAELASQLRQLGYDEDPARVLDRAVHIRPETIASRLSERSAIALKKQMESCGARVEIRQEGTGRQGRPAISAEARREVWNRDGGQCVDCGSRESLEYDHIIPISKGGANTVRNLELRCESCNRRKGATI